MLIFMNCERLNLLGAAVLREGVATVPWAFSPGAHQVLMVKIPERPSRLWQKEGRRNPLEMHAEPLHDKDQLCGEKRGEGHCSHVKPLQPSCLN